MKYIILFALFFLHTNLIAQWIEDKADSTEYVISYSVKWHIDTTKNYYTSKYILLVTQDYSEFTSQVGYHIDTLRATNTPDAQEKKSPAYMASLTYAVVPDFCIYKYADSVRSAYSIGGKLHMTSESNPVCKWKLTGEEKEVKGYKCQKAETHFAGRDYVAWFTDEIPVRDGPYKFSGLPGLIVKTHDIQQDYIFELEGFSQKKMPCFERIIKKHIQVSKSEYFKRERQFMNDIIGNMQARGVNFSQSEEELKKKSRKARLTYNPIERIEEEK